MTPASKTDRVRARDEGHESVPSAAPTRARHISVNRAIFAAIVTVGVGTFAGKLVAVVKEMVIARTFGAGDAVDAFLIAFVLPAFVINVVGGSLNAALIPTYVRTRSAGGDAAAQRLFASTMVVSTVGLVVVVAVLAAFGGSVLPLLASGFGPEKLAMTRSLFYVLLPAIVLAGISTTWGAVLNASGRFAFPAFAAAATPFLTLSVVATAGARWGPHSIAIGTVCGYALEIAIVGIALSRSGISLLPRWTGWTPDLRTVAGQFRPMIAGALVMSSNPVIDQAMAAVLGAGSVAALGYGSKAVAFVMGIGSVSVSQAVLPHFSRMTAAGDWAGIRRTLRTYTILIFVSSLAAAALVVWLSPEIVILLYRRGAFTASDGALVARVQALLCLQLPFHLTGMLFVRLISALSANRVLMWISAINAVVNVTADWLLMRPLGVAGIALSTAIVYGVSFTMAATYVRWTLNERERATASMGTPQAG